MYSELVYFDGAHFAHIAAFQEKARLGAIRATCSGHRNGPWVPQSRPVRASEAPINRMTPASCE